ncbi:MAG TPA: DUF374 domain-containing protein, partial [Crenalkalicoccus sp.]|nr:DUF374 domain-containing protein [Crenalkalicoccus sp.]
MLRSLIHRPRIQAALARLLALYLVLVRRTTRWTLVGEEHLRAALSPAGTPRGAIVAFWHECLPAMPVLWEMTRQRLPERAGMRVHVLVSRHRDGRFIGAAVRGRGVEMVHASSSRGGALGLRALLRV